MSEETGLDSWFIHDKLIMNLLGSADAAALARQLAAAEAHPFSKALCTDVLERVVASILGSGQVEALDVAVLRGNLQVGQLVWLDQAVAFRGLPAALRELQEGGVARATFSARLATAPDIRVKGDYNATRLTCSTARGELSGTKRQLIVGYVRRVENEEITLRPVVIATRFLRPTPNIRNWYPVDPAHVWPSAVDQFSGVDWTQTVSTSELSALKAIPETDIKRAFAEIIDEPDIPNDWGGEQFDLWTTRLLVEGQPLMASFLFKGPAAFKPMTIAVLGKNGDQIDRLASSPADVLVVQHCHSITAPVVNMLRAYASDPARPRRYMTIDGYATIKILRHHGMLR